MIKILELYLKMFHTKCDKEKFYVETYKIAKFKKWNDGIKIVKGKIFKKNYKTVNNVQVSQQNYI